MTVTNDASRLVGDPTLVPPRKYFTMGAYTVSMMTA